MPQNKLIRITTVPQSLTGLLKGQLKFMSEQGFEVKAISSKGDALGVLSAEEGIATIEVEMTRTISPLKDLKAVWALYRIFKKERPDIVHTHTPKAGTLGMLAAKLAGVPIRLHTVAGLPLLLAKGNKRRLLDVVEKLTYSCATKVYPNSFVMKDIILKNGYTSADKLKVIGFGSSNGIDTSFFDPKNISEVAKAELRSSLGLSDKDFIYVFVGRLVKDKGINELIEAFQKINENHPETKLILVGSYEKHLDPLLPDTERNIDENPAILSVGFQKDVRPFLAIADSFTFPSYREGFPNGLMQACAMQIPSIATDINGCNEIIDDGENGILIPTNDSGSLYGKMLYLLRNKEVRESMASKSRAKMVEKYERIFVWNEILNEYKSILNV